MYFICSFTIGPNDFQVSVVTFSSNVYNVFFLNAYQTNAEVDKALNNVSYSGGTTHTEKALEFVRQNRYANMSVMCFNIFR